MLFRSVYIDSLYISDTIEMLLQEIFNKVVVIFHNAKFDIKMLKYHFSFTFPKIGRASCRERV